MPVKAARRAPRGVLALAGASRSGCPWARREEITAVRTFPDLRAVPGSGAAPRVLLVAGHRRTVGRVSQALGGSALSCGRGHRSHRPAAQSLAEALHIGRTRVYALIAAKRLTSVKIGNLRRIPVDAVREYAARLVRLEREAS